MAFSTGAFYAFLGGAPLAAAAIFEMSPAILGFYMGTITAGFILGSFISGRFAGKHKLTTMMLVGRFTACGGLIAGLALLQADIVHEVTLFGACVFVGLGNGITMPSSGAGAMSIRPKLAGSASGLSGALTVAGGAIMSGITGVILTPENTGVALLGMMFLSSALGLAAAFYVLRINWCEG